MSHTRAHIRITGPRQVAEFVGKINSDGTTTKYMIENADGSIRVSARSLLGVIYASEDFEDTMFFVNDTTEGELPSIIDPYRVIA